MGMKMSRFIIREHTRTTTEFPLYSFPHPITFSPGAAVALAAGFLWVGLSCQSIRFNSISRRPSFSPAGAIHQQHNTHTFMQVDTPDVALMQTPSLGV